MGWVDRIARLELTDLGAPVVHPCLAELGVLYVLTQLIWLIYRLYTVHALVHMCQHPVEAWGTSQMEKCR